MQLFRKSRISRVLPSSSGNVTSMVPKASRATGYGIFECSFGIFWFLGSWLLGVLYDVSVPAMVAVSVVSQLAAIPLYIASQKLHE